MKVVRDSIFMAISNLVMVVIGIIQYPILLRLYGFPPETFGIFQYLISAVNTLSALSYLSFDLAFVAERQEHTQKQKEQFFSWYMIFSNSIGLGALFFLALGQNNSFKFIALGFCILISQSLYNGFYTLARDTKRFNIIAITGSLISISKMLLVIPIGYFVRNEIALVASFTAANILGSLFLFKAINILPAMPDKGFLSKFVSKNKQFVVFQTASRILANLSYNLPVFLIGWLFNDLLLGLYSLAYRTLLTANRIFSLVISQTFLPYMSKSVKDEKLILSKFHYFAIILFPIYFMIGIMSDYYVPILFGEQNLEVAVIIKMLVPWLFAVAVCSPVTSSYLVHKRNREYFIINGLFLAFRALALLAFNSSGYKVSLILFSIVSVIFLMLFLIRSYKFAGVKSTGTVALILSFEIVLFISFLCDKLILLGYIAMLISAVIAIRIGVIALRQKIL